MDHSRTLAETAKNKPLSLKFLWHTTVVAVFLLAMSGAAVAIPVNRVMVQPGQCAAPGTSNVDISQGVPIDNAFGSNSGSCVFSVNARSGDGGVGILATLNQANTGGPTSVGSEVFAQTIIEIDITAPKDFAGGLIPVTVIAHLDGSASASIETAADPTNVRFANSFLTAFARISQGAASSSATREAIASVNNLSPNVGQMTNTSTFDFLPDSIAVGGIFINPNAPVEVEFRLTGSFSTQNVFDSITFAGVDSFNSLSFSTSGPALILPDGFTANSVSGAIVDNQYVGGAGIVPVPGALTLFGSGLAFMGFARWRRKLR